MNAVCTSSNAQVRALPKTISIAVLNKEFAIEKSSVSKVMAIKAPGSLSSKAQAWLATLSAEEATGGQVLAAVKSRNRTELTQLAAKAKTEHIQENKQATGLGLTECTRHVTPSGA